VTVTVTVLTGGDLATGLGDSTVEMADTPSFNVLKAALEPIFKKV
jgi:hypothetical protein